MSRVRRARSPGICFLLTVLILFGSGLQEASAQRLNGNYIFSWKPHPAHLVGGFDEPLIRNYIRHTVEVAQARGCVLEMVLKDTHTCEHHPERFDRWTQIAREEVDRVSM